MQTITAEIITIGDEILIGQTIDSNSAFIASHLEGIGIRVKQIISISDTKEAITEAVENALETNHLVITTGGLGPTNDDITKKTLASLFNMKLIRNQEVLSHIEKMLTPRGVPMNKLNQQQADLPGGCTALFNNLGTAPGMWFDKENRILVSLPGVPFEMKNLVVEKVLPKLQNQFTLPVIVHRNVMTHGVSESKLAEILTDWENELPQEIKLAYLPSPGIVKLRLTGIHENREHIQKLLKQQIDKLLEIVPEYIFSTNEERLEEVVGKLLKKQNKTLGTAESCTGGKIASMITGVSGCSSYFTGSVIAYSNQVKQQILEVPEYDIAEYGAVSEAVVKAMVKGCCKTLNTDFAIATSGIAGPDGGTPEKPVGTVWIAVGSKETVYAKKYNFGKNRERNIIRASLTGLNMLRSYFLSKK